MYNKEENNYNHPPLTSESSLDTCIDNTGDGNNIPIWIKVLGLVIVTGTAGYFIPKMISSKEKKKNSQVIGKRNDYFK